MVPCSSLQDANLAATVRPQVGSRQWRMLGEMVACGGGALAYTPMGAHGTPPCVDKLSLSVLYLYISIPRTYLEAIIRQYTYANHVLPSKHSVLPLVC